MTEHRVKAFTIMEATIAMLIAAIVIGITYTVFTIVVKSYGEYNKKSQEMAVLIRLDELLKNDFDRADIIFKNADGFIFKDSSQLVSYEIKPAYILRTGGIIDTFKVKADEINMMFEKNILTETAIDDEQNRIDELQFIIITDDKKIPYHYHKQYSSLSLIKRNTNAIN